VVALPDSKKTPLAFHPRTFLRGYHEVKLTPHSCIARAIPETAFSPIHRQTHNETLSVIAVSVSNPDRSPRRING
jgi:hypothetical protein